ncbi:inversin-like [Watersipora subatra]|uniref:inversin-like n=1 Tax=Watersipora subatra TaxID=2589382 RepID=UPI00355B2B18
MAFMPLSYRLLEAATNGDISLLRKLFHNKVKTESVDENGNTPLMLAVLHNHVFAAELLLEYGANIEHFNDLHHRSVHLAAMNNNEEMLILLLSRGAQFKHPNHEGFLPIQLTHTDSKVYNVLYNAQNNVMPDELEKVNDVPIIPTYTIPLPKVKTDKGKKDKKKGGKAKKKGKRKK